MSRLFPLLRGTALIAVLAVSPVIADTSSTNRDAGAAGVPGPVSVIDAAMALAEFGREAGDPTILLGAASALQQIGATEGAGEIGDGDIPEIDKTVAEDGPTEKPDVDAETRDLVGELVGEARFLARGDEALLAQADAIEATASRSSTTGPGRYRVRVGARDSEVVIEEFRGGEVAEVAVVGDGDTDIDLVILDQNGNEICTGTGNADREYCRWTPAWTGKFGIGVYNHGLVYNNAVILVN